MATCRFCGAATATVFSPQRARRGSAFPVRTVDEYGDPHDGAACMQRLGEATRPDEELPDTIEESK